MGEGEGGREAGDGGRRGRRAGGGERETRSRSNRRVARRIRLVRRLTGGSDRRPTGFTGSSRFDRAKNPLGGAEPRSRTTRKKHAECCEKTDPRGAGRGAPRERAMGGSRAPLRLSIRGDALRDLPGAHETPLGSKHAHSGVLEDACARRYRGTRGGKMKARRGGTGSGGPSVSPSAATSDPARYRPRSGRRSRRARATARRDAPRRRPGRTRRSTRSTRGSNEKRRRKRADATRRNTHRPSAAAAPRPPPATSSRASRRPQAGGRCDTAPSASISRERARAARHLSRHLFACAHAKTWM